MKSFVKKYRECVKDGNVYEETIITIKGEIPIMICRKYGGQCRGNKCLEKRKQ